MKRNFKSFVLISIFLFAAGILASAQTYTWTGGYGNFKNPSNWSPNLPAGTTPAAFPAGTYKILSPGPCFLTENITFAGPAQIEVGSEINDGKFQLANYTLRGTVTVTVNKKGTLELSGTDEHRNLFSGGKIILKTDSTVVYYGNTGKDIWQGAYQNLIVRGPIQAQSLTVNKTLKIERNPPAENPPIQITAPVQTYNGDVTVLTNTEFRAATSVTFGRSVTATGRNLSFTGGGAVSMQGVTAGTVSAAGTSMLTVNGAVTLSGDLKAKNLTVNTATVSAAKIEVSQAATVSTAATITAPTQTYSGAVTVNADTTFNASSNLTFGSDGTVVGTGSIIVPANGTVGIQKNINLTGGTSKFEQTGTGIITMGGNASSITAATQIYKGAVTLNTDTTFSAATALTFEQAITSPTSPKKNVDFNLSSSSGQIKTDSIFAHDITVHGNWVSRRLTPPTLKIEADGNITVNGNWKTGNNPSPASVVTAGGNIKVTGKWESHESTIEAKNIIVEGSGEEVWRSWGDITAVNMNLASIRTSGGVIKVSGNLEAGIFNQADVGILSFEGSGEHTLNFTVSSPPLNKSQIRDLRNQSGGKLKLLSDIKITYRFENQGKFDANGHKIKFAKSIPIDPTFTPIPEEITVRGTTDAANTKFADFECIDPNIKKIIFERKIRIEGGFTLKGTASTPLTVEGGLNSGIELNGDKTGGMRLKVKTNIPITSGSYTVSESIADGLTADINAGKPENWIFDDYAGALTWTAGASSSDDKTKWDKAGNWLPRGIPGIKTDVKIESGKAAYPKLESTTNAKAKTVTVNSGAQLDLASFVITDDSGGTSFAPLEIFGTLKMTGTSGQTTWLGKTAADDKITHKPGSTVAYYGTTNNALWGGPYKNLTVEKDRENISVMSTSLKVDEKFTVESDPSDRSVTVDAPGQTYNGAANIGANTTFKSAPPINFMQPVNAGVKNLLFNGGGAVFFDNTLNAGTVTAIVPTSLTVKNTVSLGGNLAVRNLNVQTGAVTAAVIEVHGMTTVTPAAIITAPKQTYNGAVTLSADTEFKASEKLILKGSVKVASKFTQTGDAAVQIGAPITDTSSAELPANKISFASKNIYFTDGTTLDPSNITITNRNDCNIFVAGNLTLKNELRCGNFVLFGGTVAFASSSGGITTTGDMVLLGAQYKADDTGTSDPSGVTGLFTYNHLSRKSDSNPAGYGAKTSLEELPAALPDGTLIPSGLSGGKYSGALTNLAGKTLKASKNFYANGMNLTAGTTWNLTIPNNDAATAAFAEAYFTTVSNCGVSGGGFVAAAEGCSVSNSPSWKTDRPTIVKAYTVSDDTIYVKFNEKIENSNNEISAALANIKYNNGSYSFSEARIVGADGKPAGTTDGKGDIAEFFLRTTVAAGRWNTDATGMGEGYTPTDNPVLGSTDRGSWQGNQTPAHRSASVDLEIPKALGDLYATLRDEHKNRVRHYAGAAADSTGANGKRYGKTEDRCPPVLAAVYTGQEQHEQNIASQRDYDAHNFIEFRYSEPVYLGDGSAAMPIIAENEHGMRALPAMGRIPNSPGGITVPGFASFSGGELIAGNTTSSLPADADDVHIIYRNFSTGTAAPPATPPAATDQKCRVRIGIAARRDGTPKKWIGYIDAAGIPAGTVTVLNTLNVRTRGSMSVPSNLEAWEKLDTTFTPGIYLSSEWDGGSVKYHPLASSWDTSPPVLAMVAKEPSAWNTVNPEKEVLVYSTSSFLVDRMEFHFFDNTPPALTQSGYWWKTTTGWLDGNSALLPGSRYDSYGGARFNEGVHGARRTTGGIRACTIRDSLIAFEFTHTLPAYNTELQKFKNPSGWSQKAENAVFFGLKPPGYEENDNLYLQLKISSSSFPATEPFTISYGQNGHDGFITDLAGNRMKPFGSATSTFDFPPEIALTVAPVGSNKMYILFSCPIDIEGESLSKIPFNLAIGSGLEVDTGVPAVVHTDTKRATGLVVTLNREVKYTDIIASQKRIGIAGPPSSMAIKSRKHGYSAVEDLVHKHIISDFAVNVVRPLFAYDEKVLDDGSVGFSSQNLYGDGSYATRVFDGSGTSGNTVHEKEDITMKIMVENVDSAQIPSSLKMFIDNMPDPASVSAEFNELTGLNSRVWLPLAHPVLPAISAAGNTHAAALDPQSVDSGTYTFKLINNPNTPGNLNYAAGSRVGFLFPMADSGGNLIMMDNDGDAISPPKPAPTPNVPLYALRLKDPNDPASIDLWSFDIASVKRQAGGASILNNVINVNTGEQTLIKVDTERAGSLSVIVMTLDGDVLKVLHSGRVEKGEHIYKWDGRNANGEPVARGLYFIRIVSPDIDETRKVMAVRE
ncbi:FlgD immunoglobulin-like domain containing protein [Treponema maltophilum]|uniref:FlgD immunoglobulin-like domain containing protein n=1 Tax=Treponema maltophilum TaxID=51160 RepID=UPI003D8E67D9